MSTRSVTVWLCAPDQVDAAGGEPLWRSYRALLSDDESARLARIKIARVRREFLLARALLRYTLSRYAPVAPPAWRFEFNRYGKPTAAAAPPFNLSHSGGMVACAVDATPTAGPLRLGVDIEYPRRNNDLDAIAGRFFSTTECAELFAQPATARGARFFDYWTLKEAYIKARGMGLSLPLGQFSLVGLPQIGGAPEISAGGTGGRAGAGGFCHSIGIRFGPAIDDDPQRWAFALMTLDCGHRLALCVERDGGRTPAFDLRYAVPGVDG